VSHSHTSSSPVDLQAALAGSLERLCRHYQAIDNRFPTVGEETSYLLTENDNWLTGFWTGLLWLAYTATGDEQLRAHAEVLLPSFEERLDKWVHINHDLDFSLPSAPGAGGKSSPIEPPGSWP